MKSIKIILIAIYSCEIFNANSRFLFICSVTIKRSTIFGEARCTIKGRHKSYGNKMQILSTEGKWSQRFTVDPFQRQRKYMFSGGH